MAKTACEEAADEFAELDRAGILELLPDEKGVSSTLIKRLRAEGRELRRLRTIIEAIVWKGTHDPAVAGAIRREAARIQKARKAK